MIDTVFTYKTSYNVYGLGVSQIEKEAFCRLRVNGWVAISTELPNSGKSITNPAEELAEQVCQYYEIPPAQLIWIEHYPAESLAGEEFSLVSFSLERSRLVKPRWQEIPKAVAMRLFGQRSPGR